MSNLSQFGGGGSPVGSQIFMSDSGPSITLADNSVLLRSGTLTTPASAPQLAATSYYQVIGTYATTPITATGTMRQVASNGAGTLIACFGDTTSAVYRSTDYGANWTTVAITANIYPMGVAYGGGRFVIVCNTNNNGSPYIMYSTNAGATWTVGIGSFLNISGIAPNSLRIAYTGTKFVCCGNVYNTSSLSAYGLWIATTTDGTSVLTNNGGYSASNMDGIASSTQTTFNIINNGATVIIYPNSAGNYGGTWSFTYSLDSGATWATTYFGGMYYMSMAFNGTKLIVFMGQKQYIWADFGSAPTTYTTNSDSYFNQANQYQSTPITVFTAGSTTFGKSNVNGNLLQLSTDFKSAVSTKQILNSGSIFSGSDYCISGDGTVFYNTNMTTYNYCGLPTIKQLTSGGYPTGYYTYVRAA